MIMDSDIISGGKRVVLDGTKIACHMDRVKDWLAGKRIAPITIDMALTRACNYRCVYCYGTLQENERKNMTKKVLFEFIDDAAEIGVKAISLVSDGESTCSPHLYDFVTYARSKGLDIALGTNGALLKESLLPELLRCLTYLRFNVSAGEAKRYSEIHGVPEKTFHDFCSIVRKCVEMNDPIGAEPRGIS